MTQDTCGPTSYEASESWHTLPLFSSRTSTGSSQVRSKVQSGVTPQERPFCSMSSENWKGWVTTQRQEYSARVKLASPISVNEYSSWVYDATSRTISVSGCPRSSEQEVTTWKTPVTSEHRVQGSHEYHVRMAQREKASWKLSTQAILASAQEAQTWLTPAATAGGAQEPLFTSTGETWEGEGRAYRASGGHRTLTLNLQVERTEQRPPHQEAQTWPTPTTQEVHHPYVTLTHTGRRAAKNKGASHSLNLADAATLEQRPPHLEALISTNGSLQESPMAAWAAPYAGTKDHEAGSLRAYLRRAEIGKQISLHGQITLQANEHNGKLNPRWVETLMGLPVGWTMRSCATPWIIEQMSCDCSGTESSPPQPSEPSVSCGDGR